MFGRLLLTALLAATLALAQRGGMGGDDTGGGGGMGNDMGASPRMPRQTPFDVFADRLKLNKDQKTEAQTIVAGAMKESAPLRQQLIQGRAAIANAILSGKSAEDLKNIMDTYTSVAAEVTGVEVKTFSKVCALLKPNQQGKAAPAFELLAGMFSAAGSGGGRRGRN
jgi:hypothetical protein